MHLTTHIAKKTYATTIMLANGVNIGVVSKLLGHASLKVTLDSYGAYTDQLMLQQVEMIREKLVSDDGKFKIYEMESNSAMAELTTEFKKNTGLN